MGGGCVCLWTCLLACLSLGVCASYRDTRRTCQSVCLSLSINCLCLLMCDVVEEETRCTFRGFVLFCALWSKCETVAFSAGALDKTNVCLLPGAVPLCHLSWCKKQDILFGDWVQTVSYILFDMTHILLFCILISMCWRNSWNSCVFFWFFFSEMCHLRGLVSSSPLRFTGRDEASWLYSKSKWKASWNMSTNVFFVFRLAGRNVLRGVF